MAGHAHYTAVLDACVLYPIACTDALISIAAEGLYAAKWTRRIETEWMAALERNRPDLAGRLERRRDAMRRAVLDREITEEAWRSVTTMPALPDPDDAHVLAAAIVGHADCIVTRNHRDFPKELLDPLHIQVIDPDVFIMNQWDLEQLAVIAIFRSVRANRKKPGQTPTEFAASFEAAGLPLTAARLRTAVDLL
ncbi:MAG: PIN domain-containing protein [Burkholderiales bacterium]|jgi:predicted nucleic acid-binding protein